MIKPENLKIKGIKQSWGDLSRWSVKGGSKIDSRWFYRDSNEKTWKNIIADRLPFIEAITNQINFEIIRGASSATINTYCCELNVFMKWVDKNNIILSINPEDLKTIYLAYDEYCYIRCWGKKEITQQTAYANVHNISQHFSKLLELPPHRNFRYLSRVIKSYSPSQKKSLSRTAEKQHLGNSRELGYYCVDIADAIDIEAIYGRIPITINSIKPDNTEHKIQFPQGLIINLNRCNANPSKKLMDYCCPIHNQDDISTLDRYRLNLVRLKLLAELIIFVYQTGMNVSQILRLERIGFSYNLQGNNDWIVTCNKGRKQGAVKFKIYKEYKTRLKKLIDFVNHFYPKSKYLFPVSKQINAKGSVHYETLRKHLEQANITWIPPKVTRSTRINFLSRIIDDPNLSAEMSQHTKETFGKNYHTPSQQRAMTALTHFWTGEPVSLINSGCSKIPFPTKDKPSNIINPNCINESGCLWCESHRDIESEDYVWSLATFRYLKIIEASQPIKRKIPADIVVEKLTKKIQSFKIRNDQTKRWAVEALLRIDEGSYHPNWIGIINFWETK